MRGWASRIGAQNSKIIFKITIVKVFSIDLGLQRTQRRKELGTAHHNDEFNATLINLKGNVFVNTCKHTYKFYLS